MSALLYCFYLLLMFEVDQTKQVSLVNRITSLQLGFVALIHRLKLAVVLSILLSNPFLVKVKFVFIF